MIYELSWTCVLPLAIESLHDPSIVRNFGMTPRSSKVADIMCIILECIRIANVYHLRKKLINTLTVTQLSFSPRSRSRIFIILLCFSKT